MKLKRTRLALVGGNKGSERKLVESGTETEVEVEGEMWWSDYGGDGNGVYDGCDGNKNSGVIMVMERNSGLT